MKAALITEEQIKAIKSELLYAWGNKETKALTILKSLKVQEPVAEVDRGLLASIGWHCLCIPKDETLLYAGEQA